MLSALIFFLISDKVVTDESRESGGYRSSITALMPIVRN